MAGLEDARRWLNEVREERLAAQLGGAAGTLASLGDAGPAVAEAYADALGLPEPLLPWHTLRGRIGELGVGARGDVGRGGEGGARHRAALPDRGRRGPRGRGWRLVGDAAQAQPGGRDLRRRVRAAGAGPGGDAARRDGARARARGRLVARGVAAARRAAALDRLGGRVAARVARGAGGRPGADAREPRRDRRADAGRAREGRGGEAGDASARWRPRTSRPRWRSSSARSARPSCSTPPATSGSAGELVDRALDFYDREG